MRMFDVNLRIIEIRLNAVREVNKILDSVKRSFIQDEDPAENVRLFCGRYVRHTQRLKRLPLPDTIKPHIFGNHSSLTLWIRATYGHQTHVSGQESTSRMPKNDSR
jgi:hypothetical protein